MELLHLWREVLGCVYLKLRYDMNSKSQTVLTFPQTPCNLDSNGLVYHHYQLSGAQDELPLPPMWRVFY